MQLYGNKLIENSFINHNDKKEKSQKGKNSFKSSLRKLLMLINLSPEARASGKLFKQCAF